MPVWESESTVQSCAQFTKYKMDLGLGFESNKQALRKEESYNTINTGL